MSREHALRSDFATDFVVPYSDYQDSIVEAYCYISDLLREAQNTLLGELFDKKIQPRQPKDKSCKVVTTDPEVLEDLKRYFEDQSPFGVQQKKILSEHGLV